ncbi:MAG: S1 RNA-binding domain-containing protein, partial [Holophagae bacterium]|nr:S1 RNA-binding domain-containing protein [Holophagae bacterium]
MSREMLINVSEGEECRVAIVEKGSLEELYIERTSFVSHVGSIYKGKVINVEAGIQAAFIDFGAEKNGFLHISDLHPRYFGKKKNEETIGRRKALAQRPPIQQCLKKGQEVVVQVTKEGL